MGRGVSVGNTCPEIDAALKELDSVASGMQGAAEECECDGGIDFRWELQELGSVGGALEGLRDANATLRSEAEGFATEADELEGERDELWDSLEEARALLETMTEERDELWLEMQKVEWALALTGWWNRVLKRCGRLASWLGLLTVCRFVRTTGTRWRARRAGNARSSS